MKYWHYFFWLILLPALTAIDLIADDRGASNSVIWAVHHTNGLVAVIWPLVAALGCSDGVRLARAWSFVETFPSWGYLKIFASVGLKHGLAASCGFVAATIVSVFIGVLNGSTFGLRALAPLPLTIIGTLAFAVIGFSIGLLARRFIVSPVLAVAIYALFAFDIGGFSQLMGYSSGTSAGLIFTQYSMPGVWTFCLVVLLLLALSAGLCLTKISTRVGALVSAALLIGFLISVQLLNQVDLYEPQAHGDWECRENDSVSVCLPIDQKYRLPVVIDEATEVVTLTQDLTGTTDLVRIDFSDFEWEYPITGNRQEIGENVLNGLSTCLVQDSLTTAGLIEGEPLSETELDSLLDDYWTLSGWVGSQRGYSSSNPHVTKEEASQAIRALQDCE